MESDPTIEGMRVFGVVSSGLGSMGAVEGRCLRHHERALRHNERRLRLNKRRLGYSERTRGHNGR